MRLDQLQSGVVGATTAPESKADWGVVIGIGMFVAALAGFVIYRPRPKTNVDELDELEHELEDYGAAPGIIDTTGVSVEEPGRAWSPGTHGLGRAPLDHNPPSWVVDEPIWQHAKAAIRPSWNDYAEPWAAVTHVYEQMGGRVAA